MNRHIVANHYPSRKPEGSHLREQVASAIRKGMRHGEIETRTKIRKEERMENIKRSRAGQKENKNMMPKDKLRRHMERQHEALEGLSEKYPSSFVHDPKGYHATEVDYKKMPKRGNWEKGLKKYDRITRD